LVALKPIHDAAQIERINVATYQSVSGAGKEGVENWPKQSVALMSGKGPVKPKVMAAQIAYNLVPQIDKFQDNGYTKEEMKMFWETRKIFGDPDIRVNATTVRVPVFFGHSEDQAQRRDAPQDVGGRGSCIVIESARASSSSTRTSRRPSPDAGRRCGRPGRTGCTSDASQARTSLP
jgi:aspartate-semialdehyde dehydrogenase